MLVVAGRRSNPSSSPSRLHPHQTPTLHCLLPILRIFAIPVEIAKTQPPPPIRPSQGVMRRRHFFVPLRLLSGCGVGMKLF